MEKTQVELSREAFIQFLDKVARPKAKPRRTLVQYIDPDGNKVTIKHTRCTKKTKGKRIVRLETPLMHDPYISRNKQKIREAA